jgi:hypothetical protein
LKFELLTPAAGEKKEKKKEKKAWNGVEVRSMFVIVAAASII